MSHQRSIFSCGSAASAMPVASLAIVALLFFVAHRRLFSLILSTKSCRSAQRPSCHKLTESNALVQSTIHFADT